jgi:hypothetical protein
MFSLCALVLSVTSGKPSIAIRHTPVFLHFVFLLRPRGAVKPCLPAAAERNKRRQFRNDCHALSVRAPRTGQGRGSTLPRKIPRMQWPRPAPASVSPVPCRAAASHGCFAGHLGPTPCARSERKRVLSRGARRLSFCGLTAASSAARPARAKRANFLFEGVPSQGTTRHHIVSRRQTSSPVLQSSSGGAAWGLAHPCLSRRAECR